VAILTESDLEPYLSFGNGSANLSRTIRVVSSESDVRGRGAATLSSDCPIFQGDLRSGKEFTGL